MTYLFIALAALAWIGFFWNMRAGESRGMAYSAAVFLVWVVAAFWWSGRFG